MYSKQQLASIVLDQQKQFKLPVDYVKRDIEDKVLKRRSSLITIITGVRLSGKSTLLLKIKEYKGGGYYVNFDDERLAEFTLKDFQTLYEVLLELNGDQEYFFFDEIQNVPGWERFVRRMHDWGKKIFIISSNSRLLSPELGTYLTGRYIQYELFPFSFREYLRFRKIKVPKVTKATAFDTHTKVKLVRAYKEYMRNGGFPLFLKEQDPGILKLLYENILYKDVVARFKVSNIDAIEKLARFSLTNFARYVSFKKLAPTMGVKNVTTVGKYFDYLQRSYLVFLLYKYDYSVKAQYMAPKKIYAIDTGLAKVAGFNFSEDLGHALENNVFLELRRRFGADPTAEIFYFKNNGEECDFVVHQGSKVTHAVQVTAELTPENRGREIAGLLAALRKFNLKAGVIVTLDQQETLQVEGHRIHVLPVYKWGLM